MPRCRSVVRVKNDGTACATESGEPRESLRFPGHTTNEQKERRPVPNSNRTIASGSAESATHAWRSGCQMRTWRAPVNARHFSNEPMQQTPVQLQTTGRVSAMQSARRRRHFMPHALPGLTTTAGGPQPHRPTKAQLILGPGLLAAPNSCRAAAGMALLLCSHATAAMAKKQSVIVDSKRSARALRAG